MSKRKFAWKSADDGHFKDEGYALSNPKECYKHYYGNEFFNVEDIRIEYNKTGISVFEKINRDFQYAHEYVEWLENMLINN